MADYTIEFRFHGYTNKYAERLIYEVARKFRIKGITRKKAVPHITLFGPFTTSYEKRMISEVINIAEKYTLVPFKVKGFNFVDNATNKVIYLDTEPSEELKQLRFELSNRLRKITNTKSSQDRKSKNKFHFHAPIAFKDIDKKFDQVWSYLKEKEEMNIDINQYLLRITILKDERFLCEYDLLLKRRLNRIQALSKHIYRQTIDTLKEEQECHKYKKIHIKKRKD
jgi:2'-5' RNA ligase